MTKIPPPHIEDVCGKHALVLVSGGLDSAFMLWLMSKNSKMVEAHHVDTGQPFEKAQSTALQRQIKLLENVNLHQTKITGCGSTDFDAAILLSIPLALSFGAEHVVTGDDLRIRVHGGTFQAITSYAKSKGVTLVLGSSVNDLVKEYLKLPPEYLATTWSCREPIERDFHYHKCGTCRPCQLHKQTGLWNALPKSMPIYPTQVATE